MKRATMPVLFLLLFAGLILLIFLIMQPLEVVTFRDYISVLFPKGLIALQERNLLLILQAIMLLIVIPVFIFTFVFSWKYNYKNKNAKYDPDLTDNRTAEYFWWGIPTVLTIAVAILTYIKTDQLDPYKPIPSSKEPMTIQVVALQWKWLFIYPDHQVASLNFLQIPVGTPIRFDITSDAPMNSFWIPHLGGQIYAMPGMKTTLHLIADEPGDFRGSSANLSGEGFSSMHFITRASTDEEFQSWIGSAKQSAKPLEYANLSKPSKDDPVATYQPEAGLFDKIVMKYMK
jgi:cytochrome o ubiquinol oxidase subunit 2